jgi:UDP-N-acetylglucosamine diphosphorylase/glucosamine-1-phosphate N-acetyltransferase
MNYYLFEDCHFENFLPLSYTRSVGDIRIGRHTFIDRVQKLMTPSDNLYLFVRPEIENLTREKYPELEVNPPQVDDGIWLSSHVYWTEEHLVQMDTTEDCHWVTDGETVGYTLSKSSGHRWVEEKGAVFNDFSEPINSKEILCDYAQYLWDIIDRISKTIEEETSTLNFKTNVHPQSENVHFIGRKTIYVHETVTMDPSIVINAEKGGVIIMENVQIQSFSYLEGPLFIDENSRVKSHTHLSNSVIGPVCKIGGEIENCVFQGYSNKVHDGHLGDAFLGEWVNLGAGTTNSNLKNNYSNVKVNLGEKILDSGKTNVGSLIGDHVKTGIGSQLSTGTVISPCSNIISSINSPNYFGPFSWFINGELSIHRFDEFIKTAIKVKERRGLSFSEHEKRFYNQLYYKIYS